MRWIISFCVLFLFSVPAEAQLTRADSLKKALETTNLDTVAWTYGGALNLGLNQGFLHNWPAGGELASLTVNGQFAGYINRVYHRHLWANNLDMTYGLFYAYSSDFRPRKVDDRLDFTSKYGVQMDNSNSFYFSALVNFKTQFTEGYDYSLPNWDSLPTSAFLSPAYITGAIGVEFRKGNNISLFLSPFAARLTLADRFYTRQRPEGAFGIQYNETSRRELGAYFSGRYQVQVNKSLLYRTRVDLYMNYLAKDKFDEAGVLVKRDNVGNIDILWDNFFSYKISRYLDITVAATFIYDNDIPYEKSFVDEATGETIEKEEPGTGLGWWQVKQLLTIGFRYKF